MGTQQLPWELNSCHENPTVAMGTQQLPWELNSCHENPTVAMGTQQLPWELNNVNHIYRLKMQILVTGFLIYPCAC